MSRTYSLSGCYYFMQPATVEIYLTGLAIILGLFTLVWIFSVPLRNVSIVDMFWGLGFVVACLTYYWFSETHHWRGILVLVLTAVWGIRLSLHIGIRNAGKVEDYRYTEFRKRYGEQNYWWFSFFQVFLLQGILLWLISAPLLLAQIPQANITFSFADGLAIVLWTTGFIFEAGGDYQLMQFRSNPSNKGKVLREGLWKYTRHPNYFGDALIWWSFATFGIAAGHWWPLLSAGLMNLLLLKVSGVALLEKNLTRTKPEYEDYIKRTPAFFPWLPKSNNA